jgi:riboflavin synthase
MNSMFTGLIEATGRVESIDGAAHARRLRIATPLAAELAPGDSIAVNGVCLTATALDAGGFSVDVSQETLRVTTFASLVVGHTLNLERPMRADGRFGGHFVQGHVDGVGLITTQSVGGDGDHASHWMQIDFPPELSVNFILKGSVAVDGVSLTIASLSEQSFGVQIIPFTWAHTAFHFLRPGDAVNLEVDMLGKYVQRFLRSA